ncbi:MAG: glycosyltransferase [Candidatus Binatia bacterium]
MRFVLFGRFGLEDAGEDVVLECLVRALRTRDPAAVITLASFAPAAHRDLVDTVHDARDDGALAAAVAAADLVIVAGGTCWRAASTQRPTDLFGTAASDDLFHPGRALLMAAASGVRSALFANGFEPAATAEAGRGVAALVALADFVSVRDDESASALRAAGFAGGIVVTADPTFAIVPDAACVPAARRKPFRLGVVVSPGAVAADTIRAIADALRALATRLDVEVLLLPTLGAGAAIADREAPRVAELGRALQASADAVITAEPLAPASAARWLATCDGVVITHRQGLILAAVANTPAVAAGDDPALHAQARALGCADLALEPAGTTPQAIERRLEQILSARDPIAHELAARVAVARGVLDAGYDSLLAAVSSEATDRHAAQLAAYERICNRLRARLEEREESWRTLASFLGREVEAVASVSTEPPQRSRHIQVLKARVEAAESELDAIKRSRGWRVLHRYGVFKHDYLLPAYRALRSFSRSARRSTEPAPAPPDDPAPVVLPPGSYDVVCFPIIDWDFRYQRPQQLMARFAAAGHRVFYLAPNFLAPDAAPIIVEKAPNVLHVTLGGLPRNIWTEALEEKALEPLFASLDRLRVEQGLGATLACVQLPFWWPLAARARERFAWPLVYDCMDDHAGFSTHTGATDAHEHALFTGSDLTIASSALLLERARQLGERTMLLRNACDYEHFATTPRSPADRGPRPVIGYYGAIADWFDSDLVADLAERRPDWDVVLVGSTDSGDVTRLAALPNVRLPGEQPYADIPRWLASFDVTLLPFKRNPLTEVTNPVKAYEIFAAGKPLVSVPLPEMLEMHAHEGLVRLAATAAEFEREISAALAPDDARHVAARQAFARANTWQARYEDFAAAVPALFPKASTVIVTYGNLALTEACLASVWARTEWPNHEVIVVDNASTDGTPEVLRRLAAERTDLVAICNDQNLGFAAACNQGLARATGDYLVLLNNDTVITRGWLSGLIRHLHAVPEIGLIGPVTNEIGNEAKVAVTYATIDAMPAWAARFTRAHRDRLHSLRMLAMFCVAMRREAFTEIGPLDERFGVGLFEDDDYARRVHAKGYRTVCAHDVFVHHVGGASFKRLDPERYRAVFAHNRHAYEQKWGLWSPHQDQSATPRVEKLRAELDAIVRAANVPTEETYVFLRGAPDPTTLPDRAERFAAALAAEGMLVFVHEPRESGDGFRALAPNLWAYGGPTGTLEHLEAPVLWATPGNALDAFRWLTRRVVYDVSGTPGPMAFDGDVVRENHARMLREADVVVYGSRAAERSVRPRRPDAIPVPDGYPSPSDDEAATAPLDPAFATLVATGRPVAGHYGDVDRSFDVALVEAVAHARPDWTFAIVGCVREDAPALAELAALPNVCLVVPKDGAGPSHRARFTIAMMPFCAGHDDAWSCRPEQSEYVAAGLPIVRTRPPDGVVADATAGGGSDAIGGVGPTIRGLESDASEGIVVAETVAAFAAALDVARGRASDPAFRDRLRDVARAHPWSARARQVGALLRARPRAAVPTPAPRPPRHATLFAGQRVVRGTCNVCGHTTGFYFEDAALYRESLVCGECLTTSRYRSMARGILEAIRDLTGLTAPSLAALAALRSPRRLRIYDTQVPFYYERNAYPLPDLLTACAWIEVETSTLRSHAPLGSSLGPRQTNQNLEQLTFPDAHFDLVLTSDVMEHVRLDARAHREIRRVLRPDGVYVFTVPHHREPYATTTRVVITDPDDPARDVFVMAKEFHGDANNEENAALAYRTYGRELDTTLARLGFRVAYSKEDLPEIGVLNTELFYCRVTSAIGEAEGGNDGVEGINDGVGNINDARPSPRASDSTDRAPTPRTPLANNSARPRGSADA